MYGYILASSLNLTAEWVKLWEQLYAVYGTYTAHVCPAYVINGHIQGQKFFLFFYGLCLSSGLWTCARFKTSVGREIKLCQSQRWGLSLQLTIHAGVLLKLWSCILRYSMLSSRKKGRKLAFFPSRLKTSLHWFLVVSNITPYAYIFISDCRDTALKASQRGWELNSTHSRKLNV